MARISSGGCDADEAASLAKLPAIENAANLALIEFVADLLGIAKRSVRIVSGHASRRKTLESDGVDTGAVADTFALRQD